jgi:pimeloyl-ACP methyl ester carboxylesterase
VREPASRLREAVHGAGDPPVPVDLMACQDGAVSICVGGGDPVVRDCGAGNDAYVELHGRFDNPMMQEGTRPYETEGGQIPVDASGLPIPQGTEQVCFSLSIPQGVTMPDAGWPIVVFSHGTGGNFRSAMRDEVAGALASVQTDGGQTVSFAVLGYDGAMHGDRRGGSERGEDELFFNAVNPPAARDNVLQGAADLYQIVRLLRNFDVDPQSSPIGQAIRFDSTKIYFFGHSQGSTVGALFAPYEDDVDVAVFSGAGAHLVSSLLHKTSPVDATVGMSLILQEPWENLQGAGPDHPILNLLQAYFDPADAINYNRLLVRDSVDGGTHFLETYGLGDTYSPVDTLRAFARSAWAGTVTPVLDPTESPTPDVDPPVTGNVHRPGVGDFTAVCSQHEPAVGDDGHFVVFDDATANRRMLQFFATAATSATGTPTLVQ